MTNKVTAEGISAKIVSEQYAVWPGTTTTVCRLFLENGFNVTGESACVDPANFDEQIGRDLAYKQAFAKIWPLEGYLLSERLFKAKQAKDAAAEAFDKRVAELIGGLDEFYVGMGL